MELARLTRLLRIDDAELQELIERIEESDGDERARLMADLHHLLQGGLTTRRASRMADAVAADLGFD
jgi:signal transduction histidine kinase